MTPVAVDSRPHAPALPRRRPVHALSIDVEDWYHDTDVPLVAPLDRVEYNTLGLLDLLAVAGVRATFFLLGEVVQRFPSLARRVAAAGHELGSHGYCHRKVMQLTRREFRADVARSLQVIEDATGAPVRGYRAPYFSIKAGVRWPIDILGELGIAYDASILAIDRPPGLELVCPRQPFRHDNGVWEIPVSVLQVGRFWYLPLASGTGVRLLPRWLLHRCVRRFERDVGPGVFYLHPWEIDPDSPTAPGATRWLLRVARGGLADELRALLRHIPFAPIAEVFAAQLSATAALTQ